MNARQALQLLEYQVEDDYDLSPDLRKATTTLSAALDERDALLKVLSEFVQDIEAVGIVHVNAEWPDLAITYHKARATIAEAKGTTKDATEPAIRTQAQLMQEWGQARFVMALVTLADWARHLAHGDPYSEDEILALQAANDDAFELFSSRAVNPTP